MTHLKTTPEERAHFRAVVLRIIGLLNPGSSDEIRAGHVFDDLDTLAAEVGRLEAEVDALNERLGGLT